MVLNSAKKKNGGCTRWDYSELANSLRSVQAGHVSVISDVCYAGNAKTYIKKHLADSGKSVCIFTSTDEAKLSNQWKDPGMLKPLAWVADALEVVD